MTSSSDFKKSPWAKENQHVGYRKSIFSMTPAPEYANSEVLLSSLYRIIGFGSVSEGGVPKAGKDLIARIQKYKERKGNGPDYATIDVDSWGALLQGVLESPKLPNQSSKRFIQVTPLVPSLAIFSGSARLSDNSWPAGSLVRRMVWMGSRDHSSAVALWSDLFQALSVSETDDVFARWLEQEVSRWCPDHNWEFVPFEGGKEFHLDVSDFDSITFMPARAFVKDLRAIIDVKDSMTRRQWTSLLEGVIRIASVSHVIWLCDVQARVWSVLLDALEGAIPSTEFEIRNRIFPSAPRYFPYGSKALNGIKDKVSRYLEARLGINSLLWGIEESGVHLEGELVSSTGVLKICMAVYGGRPLLAKTGAKDSYIDLRENESRVISCKRGIGVNMLEFSRHVLGQRQTAEGLLRGYDQSFFLKKKGPSSTSPWVVSLGPVAILAFVHCSLHGMAGPRSIYRLGQHLGAYGLVVESQDLVGNDLGHQLRMLGLVLDSPDAESGMLLLAPFETKMTTGDGA